MDAITDVLPAAPQAVALAPVVRKPRLTDQLLADLPEAVTTLQNEIDYLRDAVRDTAAHATLHARLKQRLNAIERSHDWLRRHVEAVTSQRAAGVPEGEE
jgi:hypothetical protein